MPFITLTAPAASAQTTYTWTGAVDQSWIDPLNWSPNTGFPGSADNARIVAAANSPLLDANRTVTGLDVLSGALGLNGFQLTYTGTGNFSGGSVGPGTLVPNAAVSATTFSGTVFNCTLSGTSRSIVFSGSQFNGDVSLTRTAATNDVCLGGNVFNGTTDFVNAGIGSWYITSTGTDQMNGNLSVGSTGTGTLRLGGTSGIMNLAVGRTLAISSVGFNTGLLQIRGFVQAGGTSQSLTLGGSGTISFLAGASFGGDLTVNSPRIQLNGGSFAGACRFTKTGPVSDISSGGCSFLSTVELNTTNTGAMVLENTADDVYGGVLSVGSTGAGGIQFGSGAGHAQLQVGSYISISSNGFSAGQLILRNVVQAGTAGSVLVLTGSSQLQFGAGTVLGGSMNATAPSVLLNGGKFDQSVRFVKTGPSNDLSIGGCTFHGSVDLINSGTGEFRLHNTGNDLFDGVIRFGITSTGSIRTGYTSGTASLSSTASIGVAPEGLASGFLQLRRLAQVGPVAQSLALTGTAALEIGTGCVFQAPLTITAPYLYLNGGTFADASFTKTGPAADASTGGNTFNGRSEFTVTGAGAIWLNNTGNDQFNGDLVLNCIGAGGLFFGMSGGSSSLAIGRTISVGAGGFNAGVLSLRNFSQLGSTPQAITLTGSGSLRFQTGVVFNGALTTNSPGLLLDGGTFNGAADFIRTGSVVNVGRGGCTFNAPLRLRSIGSGGLFLSNLAPDAFNSSAWFQRIGTGSLHVGYSFPASCGGDISTVGSNGTVEFGNNGGGLTITGSGTRTLNGDPAWPLLVQRLAVNSVVGADLRLAANVRVSTQIDFIAGILKPLATTSASNGLLILGPSVLIGDPADNGSYVDGFVRKEGTGAFTFPVGGSGSFAPIAISSPANATDHFTARYMPVDPDPIYSVVPRDPSLDHLSRCEYWILDRTAGASNVSVRLSWDTPRSCGVDLLPDLRVARWDGSMWRDHGNGGTMGNTTSGSLLSAAPISTFSPFTLASSSFSNPLPVELLRFNAELQGNDVLLEWTTASERNFEGFRIERSADAVDFGTIGTRPGSGDGHVARTYEWLDREAPFGLNYYRLGLVDRDGTEEYSPVVAVRSERARPWVVYPLPAQDHVMIRPGSSSVGDSRVILLDATGRVALDRRVPASAAGREFVLELNGLAPGSYRLIAGNDTDRTVIALVIEP